MYFLTIVQVGFLYFRCRYNSVYSFVNINIYRTEFGLTIGTNKPKETQRNNVNTDCTEGVV